MNKISTFDRILFVLTCLGAIATALGQLLHDWHPPPSEPPPRRPSIVRATDDEMRICFLLEDKWACGAWAEDGEDEPEPAPEPEQPRGQGRRYSSP
jgi:hypothetical protein